MHNCSGGVTLSRWYAWYGSVGRRKLNLTLFFSFDKILDSKDRPAPTPADLTSRHQAFSSSAAAAIARSATLTGTGPTVPGHELGGLVHDGPDVGRGVDDANGARVRVHALDGAEVGRGEGGLDGPGGHQGGGGQAVGHGQAGQARLRGAQAAVRHAAVLLGHHGAGRAGAAGGRGARGPGNGGVGES